MTGLRDFNRRRQPVRSRANDNGIIFGTLAQDGFQF